MRFACTIVDSRCAITSVVFECADALQRPLDRGLGLVVDGGGRLVEDQDRRVFEQRARDGQPLALAAGELLAALADDRLEAVRHALDELVASAASAAALTSANVAPALPYAMFSPTVPWNRNTSWLTKPICAAQAVQAQRIERSPSSRISPASGS